MKKTEEQIKETKDAITRKRAIQYAPKNEKGFSVISETDKAWLLANRDHVGWISKSTYHREEKEFIDELITKNGAREQDYITKNLTSSRNAGYVVNHNKEDVNVDKEEKNMLLTLRNKGNGETEIVKIPLKSVLKQPKMVEAKKSVQGRERYYFIISQKYVTSKEAQGLLHKIAKSSNIAINLTKNYFVQRDELEQIAKKLKEMSGSIKEINTGLRDMEKNIENLDQKEIPVEKKAPAEKILEPER